ncbi:TIM barrel protein [Arthrobacter sp. JZ12]|uniref:sugar phosphate isomerase/epimerase family protein n=1 Tax=Arthrobacter sp. JZ12 TaxID=2654190 RepID=UPI002B4836CF|nr:sugar phosphate isomerase/epimerase [Arthrobacter sp. JZ12]WRH23828.1 TIM barrel protein [Arthrobacter sp. JZ12]
MIKDNTIVSGTARKLAAAASLAVAATAVLAGPAVAAPASGNANAAAECAGRSVPASKISFQLYSYAGWQQEVGTEGILAELAEIGYKNVEPFGASYEGRSAEEFRDLLKEYGLKAPSAHGSTAETTFDETLAYAKTIGQKYTGSGGWASPGINRDGTSTYADVLATAEAMNRLGQLSTEAGTGKHFGHNHWWEFTTLVTNPETGERTTAYEVLLANTDPRYVAFQLDVFWASDAGVDVVDLLERYGDRIELLHIKDGALPDNTLGFQSFPLLTDVGEGDIEWGPILDAAQGHVKYYVIERDGAPATREFAEDSFNFLTCYSY